MTRYLNSDPDAVQEAALRVAKVASAVPSASEAYLKMTARNAVRDYRKKENWNKKHFVTFCAFGDSSFDVADESPSPDEIVIQKEEVTAALNLVPSPARDYLKLQFIDGWSIKDIATLYNITEASVNTAISRGKQTARERVKEGKR